MKTFIKLLLLAAVALPSWSHATAQKVLPPRKVYVDNNIQVGTDNLSPQSYGKENVKASVSGTSDAQSQKQSNKVETKANSLVIVQNLHDYTTVACDGNEYYAYAPIWYYSLDVAKTETQWICPADEIDVPAGAVIKAITFHAQSTIPAGVGTATMEVRVAETDASTIASASEMQNNRTSMTLVYSGALNYSGTEMTITFIEPLLYNGGNLRVDFYVNTGSSTYDNLSWYGKTGTSGCGWLSSGGSTSGNSQGSLNFLPKMTISYGVYEWDPADEIDFGDVLVGSTATKNAKINSQETMTVNLSAVSPFAVEPNSLNTAETTEFTLKFSPTQAINYTGKLNLEIEGETTSLNMKGVGFIAGEKAIRDEAFFEGIEYTWKENGEGTAHTNNLAEIAKDPDQIIAMLREVYTNKTIPGNLKRGYSSTGGSEEYDDVAYTGVGTIKRTSSTTASFDDPYGWEIPGDVEESGTMGTSYYRYWNMDPNQYTPKYDGVTLILLEMVDDFDNSKVNVSATGYAGLRAYIKETIKSARVITEARRTGNVNDKTSGTMFKIDCDKMNKFYLIAKGQLQLLREVWYLTRTKVGSYSDPLDFYVGPCYVYGNRSNSYSGGAGSIDQYSDSAIAKYPFIFGHMFEQFSPAAGNAEVSRTDIYQDLTKNMESFGVIHDCPNVPYVQTGHHFMMYGADSPSEDCQDVRDMMFFVPDYRMMNHSTRGTYSGTLAFQDYFRYNPDYQPKMGMFVILQDSIDPNEYTPTLYPNPDNNNPDAVTGLFHHKLQWASNLKEFLPTDDQYYELWEVGINDYGIEEYTPVYYRNSDGSYVLDENNEKKPIILNAAEAHEFTDNTDGGKTKYNYLNVYVDMHPGSQTKTYVIQGRDKGDERGPFLTLQMSNKQSVTIPGTDPNEKVHMIGTTHYSRYNAETGNNCYSNKLQITDNTLTTSDLTAGVNISFTRTWRPALTDDDGNVVTDANGNIQYVPENQAISRVIATGTYTPPTGTSNKGTLTITIDPDYQALKSAFPGVIYPTGDPATPTSERYPNYLDVVGYHANSVNSNNQLTFQVTVTGNSLNLNNCMFWDNFVEDVSKNDHPFQYSYKVYMGSAYSNKVNVGVFKTDGKTNHAFTLDDVLGDKKMGLELPDDVEFEELVQYGSKTELLRYDVYRWLDNVTNRKIVTEVGVNRYGNEEETDVAPEGQANNEGNLYTIRMNAGSELVDEYNGQSGAVSTTSPRAWAKYVDEIPQIAPNAYDYVPVIETFNFGYRENKENNKVVERDDYNTYGGPMKTAAIGKMELSVYTPSDEEVHGVNEQGELVGDPTLAQMSDYKWYDNGQWYSYYNIYLNFETLDVPENYELYKVRAWRKVTGHKNGSAPLTGKNVLGEEISTRADRINDIDENGWYMYEDINFGDPAEPGSSPNPMSRATLKAGLLGHRPASLAKPVNPDGTGGGSLFEYDLDPNNNGNGNDYVEENVRKEMRATFGALRLRTDDCPDGLESLDAQFKVRAYFTKKTNPLVKAGSVATAKPIYVIGYTGDDATDATLATLYSDDGTLYTGHVTIPGELTDKGHFRFTTQLSSSSSYFGPQTEDGDWNVNDEHYGNEIQLRYLDSDSKYFAIPAGTYNLSINLKPRSEESDDAGKITIKRVSSTPANAPRRAAALLGSDHDYFIAEGSVDKVKLEPGIITGIMGVKQDVNREVVGVTYVNPIGQMSSTPWQGVNIVVTRYSDGSTTTQKVIR